MPKIKLKDDPAIHNVKAGETLAQLEEQGLLEIPFGCYDGHCAACMCTVHEGAQALNPIVDVERYTLTSTERAQGMRLACRLTITSEDDVTIVLEPYY